MMEVRKHQTLILVFLLELILCSVGSTIEQRRFQSRINGYSLIIPEGWSQVPEDVMNNSFNAALKAEARYKFDFEAFIAKEWTNELLVYPYLAIQIIKHPNNRQLTQDEAPSLIAALTGLNVEEGVAEGVDQYGTEDIRKAMSDVAADKVSFDTQNMVYRNSFEAEVSGLGKVRGLMVGQIGRYAIVQLMFYCLESDWARFENERNLMVNSFRFDVGMRYEDVPSAPSHMFDRLGRAFARGISLAIIAGVFVIIAGVFKLVSNLIRPKK